MHHCYIGLPQRRFPPCHNSATRCFFGAICGCGPITSLTTRSTATLGKRFARSLVRVIAAVRFQMQLSPYDLAIITGAFTVLGAFIGSLVTYWLSLQLAKAHARMEAGRRLREAFASEIAMIDPVGGNKDANVDFILRKAFDRHRAAVIEFSYYVSPSRRGAFLEKWREYYEIGGSVGFENYMMGERSRELFMERVHAVLAFTET